jgi:hypothetical protein
LAGLPQRIDSVPDFSASDPALHWPPISHEPWRQEMTFAARLNMVAALVAFAFVGAIVLGVF